MEPSPDFRRLVESKMKQEKVHVAGKNLAIFGVSAGVLVVGLFVLVYVLRKKKLEPEDGVEYVDSTGRKIDTRRESLAGYEVVRESPGRH